MKKLKFVHLLLVINLLVFAGFGVRSYLRGHQRSAQEIADRQAAIDGRGGDFEKIGVMSKDDFAKILDEYDSIRETGKMDDGYLDWCLELMERPTTSANARKYVYMRKATATDDWEYWKTVTPEQRDKVFFLASKYLTTPDGQFDSAANQSAGAYMVSMTKDVRAIPLLMNLTQSRYSSVRPTAQRVLKKLQRLAARPQ